MYVCMYVFLYINNKKCCKNHVEIKSCLNRQSCVQVYRYPFKVLAVVFSLSVVVRSFLCLRKLRMELLRSLSYAMRVRSGSEEAATTALHPNRRIITQRQDTVRRQQTGLLCFLTIFCSCALSLSLSLHIYLSVSLSLFLSFYLYICTFLPRNNFISNNAPFYFSFCIQNNAIYPRRRQ